LGTTTIRTEIAMNKRYFQGLIAAMISVGLVGVASAQPNTKCTPEMQFTFVRERP
jgi:hypothetical protein